MFSNAIRVTCRSVQMRPVVSRHVVSLACNQSVEKLNDILEEYRSSHYSQEFPKRFRKDIIKAVCKKSPTSSSGEVSAEGIECILKNIGASDQMTRLEIESMLREISVDTCGSAQDPCVISADQMLTVLSTKSVV